MIQSNIESSQKRVFSLKKTISTLEVKPFEFYREHRKNLLPMHKIGRQVYFEENVVLEYKKKIQTATPNFKIID